MSKRFTKNLFKSMSDSLRSQLGEKQNGLLKYNKKINLLK